MRPHDGSGEGGRTREVNASTEKLRKQMLGKRTNFKNSNNNNRDGSLVASKPRPRPGKRKAESDDEEEGRSGLGKEQKQKPSKQKDSTENSADKQETVPDSPVAPAPKLTAAPSTKKRGGSYLDQVLAERAARKKKKQKTEE